MGAGEMGHCERAMRDEMDCKAERKGWAQRVSKWVVVNELELPPPVFGPRVRKRLKKKGLAKGFCRRVRKNIETKGVAGEEALGRRRAVRFIDDSIIKVNGSQEKCSCRGILPQTEETQRGGYKNAGSSRPPEHALNDNL